MSVLTVLVLVGGLQLLAAFADRREAEKPPEPQVQITLDWAEWQADASAGEYPGISLSWQQGPIGGVSKVVDGKKYIGLRAYEKEGDFPARSAFEYYYRPRSSSDTGIDLYVTSKVLFQFEIEHFGQGTLRNLDTGDVLKPPFILDAGEYHLEATTTEKGESEHGVPEAVGRPSQTN